MRKLNYSISSDKIKQGHDDLEGDKTMSKKLCKLVSDGFLDDHTKKYTHMVNNPKYLCLKCGRVANDEDSLCRPKKMKEKKEVKKSDGFKQISDDVASEKIMADFDRLVLGKSGKKKVKEKSEDESEKKIDKKVQKRIVKISRNALRNKSNQEAVLESIEEDVKQDEHFTKED